MSKCIDLFLFIELKMLFLSRDMCYKTANVDALSLCVKLFKNFVENNRLELI